MLPLTRRLFKKLVRPSRGMHCILNVIAVFIALEISESVLVRNGLSGAYPAEADSIGIPLMGIMFHNVGALLLALYGIGLSRQEDIGPWLGCGVIALSTLWSFSQAPGWIDPLHYEIALAQGSLGILPLIYAALEIRRYRVQRSGDA